MDGELLEWFRVDRSRGTRVLLVTGGALVFCGAGLVGAAFLTHASDMVRNAVTMVGAGMLVFGLLLAFVGMTVLLAHDEYLAVRADGILFHQSSGDVVHAWSDIERVVHDEAPATGKRGAWSIHKTDATVVAVSTPYAGASPRDLATHLEQLRMKAKLAGMLDADEVARCAIGMPYKKP